jgi:aryl-alcohol dehydrogenase-like predicted oxidoreductase
VITRLGVGLAALGRPAYINVGRDGELPVTRSVEAMRAACWAVLDEAYAAGVRRVDAARSYGLAEEFLAGWLAARGHADVIVSSKWGYAYVGEWRLDAPVHEVKEHTAARFRAQLAETLSLLGDRLVLYQVHSLTVDSPLWTDADLLAALGALRDGGIRVGFSTTGPAQGETIARALDLEVGGRRLFSAVQSTWNPLEPSAAPRLAEAHAAGWSTTVKEALANGRLAVDPPPEITALARRHGVGPDAIALAAALAQPWADLVLLGPASVHQLHSNLACLDVRLEDPAGLEDVAAAPEEYWTRRSALPWT